MVDEYPRTCPVLLQSPTNILGYLGNFAVAYFVQYFQQHQNVACTLSTQVMVMVACAFSGIIPKLFFKFSVSAPICSCPTVYD